MNEKVKKELKDEELTAHQLSERLGEEEERIRNTIQELKQAGLIKEMVVSSEEESLYQISEKEKKYYALIIPLLLIIGVIVNIIYALLMPVLNLPIPGAFPNF